MIEGFLAVLAKAGRDPAVTAAERAAIAEECVLQRASLALEQGRKAFLAGDIEAAIGGLTRANAHYRSARLALILLLLRVAPGFLRAAYQWRDRRFYKLTTQP